jgi:hypothetical protein
MRDFFNQIQRAADTDLYFLALAGALVIPDICSALESNDGIAKKERYIDWFDKHVATKYVGAAARPHLAGIDCYGLRCSLLHQGRLQPHQGGYSRILFIEPKATGTTGNIMAHNNIMNDALNIDVHTFTNDMVASALGWLATAETSDEYKANFPSFMHRYPNGLAPYIGGVPVIA